MTSALTSEDFDELHDFIRLHVDAGFSPIDEIVGAAVESFTGADVDNGIPRDADAIRIAALAIADQTVAAHRTSQSLWSSPTDCERLDAAFAELESTGILARQHFSCCGMCGAEEIHDEISLALAQGLPARGFTFFHVQDTEHAIAGECLYLSFGSRSRDRAESIAIGHEVVAVLGRHGLEPSWNGKIAHRIALPLTWQRRR